MIMRMRDVRDRVLGKNLFADPAWVLKRVPDAVDRRRTMIALTDNQMATMDRLFAAMALVEHA